MRIVSILVVSLLFLSTPMAQTGYGLKAGLNVATVSGDTEGVNISSRLGGVGGVFVQLPISSDFVVQPEILYSMKGFEGEAFGQTFTFKANYVDFLVLLGFFIPTNSSLDIGAIVGPSMSLKLSESTSTSNSGTTVEQDTDSATSTDFGVALGAQVGSGPLGVEVRYTIGISNIDAEAAEGSSIRSRVFSVTGFYRFGGR